jgi:hypothetical protein
VSNGLDPDQMPSNSASDLDPPSQKFSTSKAHLKY